MLSTTTIASFVTMLTLMHGFTAVMALSPLQRAFGLLQNEPSQSSGSSSNNNRSLLTNTKWKVKLNVGLQPGTWMPKRFPGWAESGARLGLDLDIRFTDTPSSASESLVGPKALTYELEVCSKDSTFVSEKGQQSVVFESGGYCIQKPINPSLLGRCRRLKRQRILPSKN